MRGTEMFFLFHFISFIFTNVSYPVDFSAIPSSFEFQAILFKFQAIPSSFEFQANPSMRFQSYSILCCIPCDSI